MQVVEEQVDDPQLGESGQGVWWDGIERIAAQVEDFQVHQLTDSVRQLTQPILGQVQIDQRRFSIVVFVPGNPGGPNVVVRKVAMFERCKNVQRLNADVHRLQDGRFPKHKVQPSVKIRNMGMLIHPASDASDSYVALLLREDVGCRPIAFVVNVLQQANPAVSTRNAGMILYLSNCQGSQRDQNQKPAPKYP